MNSVQKGETLDAVKARLGKPADETAGRASGAFGRAAAATARPRT
jgi:hypothetical protein